MEQPTRHPATAHLLGLFEFRHLPRHLAVVSAPVSDLAHRMADTLGDGPELSTGLRKLVEAKDCLVRQAVEDRRKLDAEHDEIATALGVKPNRTVDL